MVMIGLTLIGAASAMEKKQLSSRPDAIPAAHPAVREKLLEQLDVGSYVLFSDGTVLMRLSTGQYLCCAATPDGGLMGSAYTSLQQRPGGSAASGHLDEATLKQMQLDLDNIFARIEGRPESDCPPAKSHKPPRSKKQKQRERQRQKKTDKEELLRLLEPEPEEAELLVPINTSCLTPEGVAGRLGTLERLIRGYAPASGALTKRSMKVVLLELCGQVENGHSTLPARLKELVQPLQAADPKLYTTLISIIETGGKANDKSD